MKSVNHTDHDKNTKHKPNNPQHASCQICAPESSVFFERLPAGQQLFCLGIHKRIVVGTDDPNLIDPAHETRGPEPERDARVRSCGRSGVSDKSESALIGNLRRKNRSFGKAGGKNVVIKIVTRNNEMSEARNIANGRRIVALPIRDVLPNQVGVEEAKQR